MSDQASVDANGQPAPNVTGCQPIPETSEDSPATAVPKQQLALGLVYLVALLFCFGTALHYAGQNFKIALAWVVAGIIASQIVVDLAKFTTPEAKAKFSVLFRSLGGLLALAAAYLL